MCSLFSVYSGTMEPIAAVFECLSEYQLGNAITCKYTITNNHNIDYHVLKRFTPLEGMESPFVSVSRNGKVIPYDGKMIKRCYPPIHDEYFLLRAGSEWSTKIDLSVAYPMNETGEYMVMEMIPLHYHHHLDATFTDTEQASKSTLVSFQLHEGGTPKMTLGEFHRQKGTSFVQQVGHPRDPKFNGGTVDQQLLTKEIHRASYHYVSTVEDDISDNEPHYVSWFGAEDADRIKRVKKKFNKVLSAMEADVITYHFDDPQCEPSYYAFTYLGARDIYLCGMYHRSVDLLGIDTKLCTIVHELTHAVSRTDDIEYGRDKCLQLAKTNPRRATINADNYGYFAETTNIFDYGFDSMEAWPDGHTYVTRGNMYIRYSDDSASQIDSGYPHLIRGSLGSLPDNFLAGFDSQVMLPNGFIYVTKDNQYVRYSPKLDQGYPVSLQGAWGHLNSKFAAGFDSAAVLPNTKTYVTKGNQYIRYSDESATTVDSGYPSPLQGAWGILPFSFAESFDSMASLKDGKIYVTKNKQYVRYSDKAAAKLDPGYPQPIKGNWGKINFPGPQI